MVYGPLIHGCTTVVYEGKPVGTPDAGALWRVISEYGVAVFFTAPTAIRAVKREDPQVAHLGRYDTRCLRTLFLAGERADPDTVKWAEAALKVPVIDHYWQTESGWPMAANCIGIEPQPVKHGSPTKPVPGYDIRVLDEGGQPVAPGQSGAIAVKLPLPPGTLPTLWHNEEGYIGTYLTRFPGYYETADAGYIDADGYLFVMSRTDDVINVAGHRLSTGAMEEILAGHPAVAECAVIGVPDELKGQVPLGFVVLKAGVTTSEPAVIAELIRRVREHIGAVAAFKQAAVVPRLPKTRSGKVLRGTMRRIAAGEPWLMPATIEDPTALDGITAALRQLGHPKSVGA
jgi:propionyl-CoA synthetase